MLQFTSRYATPGIRAVKENFEKAITFGPWEHNRAFLVPACIAGAASDAGNTSYTHVLRPGLLLGRYNSAGNYKCKEWTPTATDGTEDIFGILMSDITVHEAGVDQDRWVSVLIGGNVKAGSIIVPGQTDPGLASQVLEWTIRSQMSQRFVFDDWYNLAHMGAAAFGWRKVRAITTSAYTITTRDNGTLFTNEGNASNTLLTLPAVASSKGLHYGFLGMLDGAAKLLGVKASAQTIIVLGSLGKMRVTLATTSQQIGGFFTITGLDNSKWVALSYQGTLTTATA